MFISSPHKKTEGLTEVKLHTGKRQNSLTACAQLRAFPCYLTYLSQLCNAIITCPASVSSAVSGISRPKPILHDT